MAPNDDAKKKYEMRRWAESYLRNPAQGFWRWSPEGDAIIWRSGATIVFRQELTEVLEPLCNRGLPPLGAVLLLIAATRDNWLDSDESNEYPVAILLSVAGRELTNQRIYRDLLSSLNEVHLLDDDVKRSVEAKQVLVDFVFEECKLEHGPAVAKEVVEILRGGYQENLTHPDGTNTATAMTVYEHPGEKLRSDLQALKGLKDLSAEALRLRRKTGFDALPESSNESLVAPEHASTLVRNLLLELDSDTELRGIVRAARQLMSVLALPRPIAERQELSLGGVSDITNRGPLDRLLLSELANDDLTLAVRVAVGEAMYLRRESPPKVATRQRIMVLDSGIRMWGIPRAIAAALGLAMVAGSDPLTEVETYVGVDRELISADLTTRDGLVQQMKVLHPDLHLGACLPELANKCEEFEQAHATDQNDPVDRILITSPEAIEDPEFSLQLANSAVFPVFVATVERDGQVRLIRVSKKGRKEIRSVKIDVEEIVNSRPVIDKKLVTDLPAIFSVNPFPLLLAKAGELNRAWHVQHGVVVLTSDRLLSFWEHLGKRGGQLLSETIVPAPVRWTSREPMLDLDCFAIVGHFRAKGLRLIRIDINSNREKTATETVMNVPQGVLAFVSHRDSLFAFAPGHLYKIDLLTGTVSQQIAIPENVRWKRDRFFYRGDDWFALATDEFTASLEKIPNPKNLYFQTFFECEGTEGPIGITRDNKFYFSGDNTLLSIASPHFKDRGEGQAKFLEIGRSGKEVIFKKESNLSRLVVEVPKLTFNERYYYNSKDTFRVQVKERNLRKHFSAVSIIEEDEHHRAARSQVSGLPLKSLDRVPYVISLLSKKNARVDLMFDSVFGFRLMPIGKPGTVVSQKEFSPIAPPDGAGYRLSESSWSDGTRFVLDSRGFLHLRCSNPKVPELSLTLTEGSDAAAWLSDGRIWGVSYYHNESRTSARFVNSDVLYSIFQEFMNNFSPRD